MKYLFFLLLSSCTIQKRDFINRSDLLPIYIKAYFETCIDLQNKQTSIIKIVIKNTRKDDFDFRLERLVFDPVEDSLGKEAKRIVIKEPIIKSEKRRYLVDPGKELIIHVEINFLHQFEYLSNHAYRIKNMYYENRFSKNKAEKIFIGDVEFTICN